ncbi:hypothetical protein GCM10011504_38930 [Siccirubricoccus deserti]|uniref:Flagellar assembly protein FliH/Type III secretion system HrpE domain-containing protein n=1 Tax=Siccirubricoccus deserti TaxID=2013562 RepID=A0A9X0R2B8_9PROT|nr:hypothetical protein [Siccirubricoccus deserti]MBC4017103.1 hypothetical protein [Siccirubricoccus deserti]GGC56783.1 hypothetical protein GCM10011504_38930 [Siccirubricoccus deserti]
MTGNALLLGFQPYQAARRAMVPTARRAPAGGFTVPDFDAPPPPDTEAAAAAAAAALAAAAAEAARLEEARATSHAAGEAAGLAAAAASLAARETAALEAIAAALAGQDAALAAAAEASATALAGLLLQALDSALPAAAARLAPECVAPFAAALAPLLAEATAVTLHVATGFGAATAERIADPRLTIVEDAALPPGDARAAWRGGGATLSLAARRRAVAAMLAAFDLHATHQEP